MNRLKIFEEKISTSNNTANRPNNQIIDKFFYMTSGPTVEHLVKVTQIGNKTPIITTRIIGKIYDNKNKKFSLDTLDPNKVKLYTKNSLSNLSPNSNSNFTKMNNPKLVFVKDNDNHYWIGWMKYKKSNDSIVEKIVNMDDINIISDETLTNLINRQKNKIRTNSTIPSSLNANQGQKMRNNLNSMQKKPSNNILTPRNSRSNSNLPGILSTNLQF